MSEKKSRVYLDYKATLDYGALKNLESTTVGSFLELVNKIVLIDDKPFGEVKYTNGNGKESHIKLTAGRKEDFLRLIENYAIIEFIGIKCHVMKVFENSDREKISDFLVQKRIDKMKHN